EEKQQDFVEVIESVTYAVCKEADVNFDNFCTIFKTKNVLNKLFRLIDKDLDGVVTADQVMDFISQLSSARSSSRLTTENIQWLEKLFRQYVGDGDEIRKEDFNKIIQTKNQFFTERVFEIFDQDASGSISLQEFLDCMHQFTGQNPDDKIHFLFKVYDVDGDGLIQAAELQQVMTACMEENGMKFSDEQINKLTMALFEDADVERRGALTYEALKAQLEKHGGLLENLSISIERWLVPPKPRESKKSVIATLRSWKPHQLSPLYFRNNYVYLLWLAAFLLTNIGLFLYRIFCWRWRGENYDSKSTDYLVVARAAGQCLNFNCTFIVVMMLRQTLTFLRARGAGSYLPIDQHIYFHKMTGWFIFFFSVLHTVMHLVNTTKDEDILETISSPNVTYLSFLFDPSVTTKWGLIPGCALNSGVVLMIILTLMVICSLPFVRRGGCFEVFYWTHLLYVAFWTLLVIHAPNFWKWFIGPGVIFLIEQALRYYHWKMGRGRTYIRSGMLLPSRVTQLTIKRPPNFEFAPGDYVFVRIPQIAKYEWHPFTISSAPEEKGEIHLHVRAAGQWTNRIYEYFEQEQTKLLNSSGEEVPLTANNKMPTFGNYRNRSIKANPNVGKYTPITIENNVRKVAFEDRIALKSVGDSISTLDPSSSATASPDSSHKEIVSSIEAMSESEGMVRKKEIPMRLHKPKLESTKSLPNVHGRLTDRERKLIVRQNPAVQRSLSVQSVESDPSKLPGPLGSKGGSRGQILADSLRYMRHKPTIIMLKTPTFDGYSSMSDVENNANECNERLAEEGESSFGLNGGGGIGKQSFSSFIVTATTGNDRNTGRSLEIYVDGPYGAPSSHIFRAQHAVLIATGIGVTPFASILQSIMCRYWAARFTCPSCQHTWCYDMPSSVFNLKKVDFLWINREQRSFEWFVHLLSQLEIEQAEIGGAMERFLDMHMYITSALQRTDMKAVGLQLALDLLHDKEKRDLITGLKTRTNAGRPNWNKLFKQLADQNKGKITVFYCGPPTLARTLKIKCDEFGFIFRKELF
ncbi:unnamed protein product, partial [Allacma fusca]